jgi:lysyl-tRNA synthetase class 2
MLAAARAFFASRGVLEVETPILSESAVSDPHIESIPAVLRLDNGRNRYLHTSPEYCMKRLLCGGFPDIYSICKVFRDNEVGRRHQPEFTMAEWYRLDFGLQTIIAETCAFIELLIGPDTLRSEFVSLDYTRAYRDAIGFDPVTAESGVLADVVDADDRLRNALGNDRDTWLDLIMSEVLAPTFAKDRLTVIHHYPASQAALARCCPDDPQLADRFEVFLGDLELANGFVELRDSDAQWLRWQDEQETRRRKEQPVLPLDTRLIAALRNGMPVCAGVAVGFDRLLMVRERCDDIGRVQTFAFERFQ